jgi:hypothetical protein
MNAHKPADPTVFEDTDRAEITLTEPDILGTHTFEDVLYTGETDVVNATTGETPEMLDKTVQEAKELVQRTSDDGKPPRIAKAQSSERTIDTRTPYVSSVFCHMDITGGYEWHTVLRKAWESDSYTVTHDANYTTGTLTITVEKTAENTSD